MNKLEKHRQLATKARLEWAVNMDHRALKKHENKQMSAIYIAYIEGESAGMGYSSSRNPYPAGARRDAWNQGNRLADPFPTFE